MRLKQALETLGRGHAPVTPGQPFVSGALKQEDTWGVARLYADKPLSGGVHNTPLRAAPLPRRSVCPPRSAQ